ALDRKSLAQMLLNVVSRLTDRGNLLGVFVADLELELLLQRHDQLDEIKRIGIQVLSEGWFFGHLGLVNTELIRNDRPELGENIFFGHRRHLPTLPHFRYQRLALLETGEKSRQGRR